MGEGLAQDIDEARKWMEKAAEQGIENAARWLATQEAKVKLVTEETS